MQITSQPASSQLAQRTTERLEALKLDRREAAASEPARETAAPVAGSEVRARRSERVEEPKGSSASEKLRESAVASEARLSRQVEQERAAETEQALTQGASTADNQARKDQDAVRRERFQQAMLDKKADDQATRDTIARDSREALAQEIRAAMDTNTKGPEFELVA
ncbi:hypothetical protein [Mesobacterium pallidum]|uniref:hypothetical protein n=1 Tax=Mesobacterium pallidum TaxID=2872037 RepID=UPI001EE2D221|nr:hypothetical protein [Mesobacterium pallidum]